MAPADDLHMDLDGIEGFADTLDAVTGQWDGTNTRLGDGSWLAGDRDLTAALDGFTQRWQQAAALIDTYAARLSSMAHECVDRFGQTDSALAGRVPLPHTSRAQALLD